MFKRSSLRWIYRDYIVCSEFLEVVWKSLNLRLTAWVAYKMAVHKVCVASGVVPPVVTCLMICLSMTPSCRCSDSPILSNPRSRNPRQGSSGSKFIQIFGYTISRKNLKFYPNGHERFGPKKKSNFIRIRIGISKRWIFRSPCHEYVFILYWIKWRDHSMAVGVLTVRGRVWWVMNSTYHWFDKLATTWTRLRQSSDST